MNPAEIHLNTHMFMGWFPLVPPAGHRGDGDSRPGGAAAAGAAGLPAGPRRGAGHPGAGEEWPHHHLLFRVPQPSQHPQHPGHPRDTWDARHTWHTWDPGHPEPPQSAEPHQPPAGAPTWASPPGQPFPGHPGLLQACGGRPHGGPAAAAGPQAQTCGPAQEQHPASAATAGQILHHVSRTRPVKKENGGQIRAGPG